MTVDADIQVATEGTGPHVRTLTLPEPQAVDASGNVQPDVTVHQQVVSVADEAGDLIDDPNRLLMGILDAQLRTNELLELLLGSLS